MKVYSASLYRGRGELIFERNFALKNGLTYIRKDFASEKFEMHESF